jgi:hypothetical protein
VQARRAPKKSMRASRWADIGAAPLSAGVRQYTVLQRFLEWRRERKRWRRSHDAAWAPAIEITPDGLSRFIYQARDRLTEACGSIVFEARGESERFLYGTVPNTDVTIFVYSEGAQIYDGSKELFWSEYYDYETPDHLLGRLVPAAIDAIAAAECERLKSA